VVNGEDSSPDPAPSATESPEEIVINAGFSSLSILTSPLPKILPGETILEGESTSAIAYGQVVSRTLSVAGDVNNYTFAGTAGDQILLRLRTSRGGYPELRLYLPNGTLFRTVSSNPFSYSVELSAQLPDTGTYSLLVGDREGDENGRIDFADIVKLFGEI
jgi:hypothetical protein